MKTYFDKLKNAYSITSKFELDVVETAKMLDKIYVKHKDRRRIEKYDYIHFDYIDWVKMNVHCSWSHFYLGSEWNGFIIVPLDWIGLTEEKIEEEYKKLEEKSNSEKRQDELVCSDFDS